MNAIQTLERAAIRAHARGACWAEFWSNYGNQVRAVEPYNAGRYHRLVHRLLAIVTSGDDCGMDRLESPWDADDTPAVNVVSDTTTHARLLAGVPGVVTGNMMEARQ